MRRVLGSAGEWAVAWAVAWAMAWAVRRSGRMTLATTACVAGPLLAGVLLLHDARDEARIEEPVRLDALTVAEAPARPPAPGVDRLFAWHEKPEEASAIALLPAVPGVRSRVLAYDDGSRDDILTIGAADDPAGFSLVLMRRDTAGDATASLYIDSARIAAREGAALLKLDVPVSFASGLGQGEVAQGQFGVAGGERVCLVFRVRAEAGLAFSGWSCGAGAIAPTPSSLACLLDRVAPAGSGDGAVERYLSDSPLRRSACDAPRPAVAIAAPAVASPAAPAAVTKKAQRTRAAQAHAKKSANVTR